MRKQKNGFIFYIFTVLCFIALQSTSLASTLNAEDKGELLDKLRNYHSENSSKPTDSTLELKTTEDLGCPSKEESAYDPECLKKHYLADGYYIVTIAFRRPDDFAVQPSPDLIPNAQGGFDFDYARQKQYLDDNAERAFKEFIGSDYLTFNALKLALVRGEVVEIELQVRDPDELTSIFEDPRIVYVHHVAAPLQELEAVH